MNTRTRIAAIGLVASALGLANLAPAQAVGDFENRTARMVGGGWVTIGDVENRDGANRVILGVDVPCPGEEIAFNPQPDPPGRLQVTWAANSFHLDTVTAASCTNNLHEGSGTGRCGDDAGFIVDWRLTDGDAQGVGNPDTRPDTVQLDIRGPSEACALSLSGPLGGGNVKMVAPPEPDGPGRPPTRRGQHRTEQR